MEDQDIIINLDMMLVKRKMTLRELSEKMPADYNALSVFKLGKGKAIKLKTLMRMCTVLKCQASDIIEFRSREAEESSLQHI
jgi:putative transcriptional regulator